ncbi:MAG TPA: pyridoxamine 5'-phosphate oxidase family protein, partial [Blastocatellia bacterium]|nr:pyridoxamine 5'-phosphate oxidase family protein [Blastocatellia bacterium]
MSDTDRELPQLNKRDADSNPFRQFQLWFTEAEAAVPILPNAMTLATATPEGVPSARVVLLKSFDEQGFVFYTNYESR